ncbi:hypothetical protein [Kitasatospora sp. NPDC096204]|uniref:hypothetical protein n=1 Tax=Kitasatospora sp. NPDC096204 TaxID=3364094 RepID=UPI003815E72D
MWYQQPVQNGIWTCAGSPIWPGYINTNHQNPGCGGLGSWFLQLARPGLWICPYTPIPASYHTGTYNGSYCGGLGAWVLIRN